MRIIEAMDKVLKEPVIGLSPVMILINILNLLSGLLQQYVLQSKNLSEIELEKYVVFSIAWAIGGICENPDRHAFHEYMFSQGCPIP